MVVMVVSMTGRRRWAPVLRIASFTSLVVSFRRSKVSISTMLLFTTMPASAMTPMPDMMMPKGWPMTSRPMSTPTVDMMTAERISVAL